jgi:drug/metabolite transporter (DMT)-like permease
MHRMAPAMALPFFPTLILLAALWGASFLFMRVAAPVVGPVWLIEARVLLAGLALLPLVLSAGHLRRLRDCWRDLLLIGCLNAALPFTLLAYASVELSAGTTSILNAMVPIFAALFGVLVYGERLGRLRPVGILLGFVGVVILVGGPQAGGLPPLLPVLAGLGAAVSYVLAANLARRRLSHVPGVVFVTGSQLGAALILVPLLPVAPPATVPGPAVIGAIVALALLSTSLAFLLYFRLLREFGATRTLTVTYLIPVFAILWGYWLLDEPLTLPMLVGGAFVLVGIGLANVRLKAGGP